MRSLTYVLRLVTSILRWRLIGVSNKKMRLIWKAFQTNTDHGWTQKELSRQTGLPDGSFEAEIVELDMAKLVKREKSFEGKYVRRLTPNGKAALQSIDPAKYDWHHRRWRRAKSDPSTY